MVPACEGFKFLFLTSTGLSASVVTYASASCPSLLDNQCTMCSPLPLGCNSRKTMCGLHSESELECDESKANFKLKCTMCWYVLVSHFGRSHFGLLALTNRPSASSRRHVACALLFRVQCHDGAACARGGLACWHHDFRVALYIQVVLYLNLNCVNIV
jgi:hypothetical protein